MAEQTQQGFLSGEKVERKLDINYRIQNQIDKISNAVNDQDANKVFWDVVFFEQMLSPYIKLDENFEKSKIDLPKVDMDEKNSAVLKRTLMEYSMKLYGLLMDLIAKCGFLPEWVGESEEESTGWEKEETPVKV